MNLMELFVKIGVDDQASSKLSGITGKIGGGLKTAADIGVKAVTAASTAIIGLTGLAIKNYAEYEQLVGGVETLFGNSADRLMGYAEKAFMTAGMSANQYMAIATSFSASLLQSLEGDTAKAADYADMAMQDMADNANKMGTNIDIIQQSYQSFARGNYAMLDNLKLGYGGTKSEMERLLQTANEINAEQGIMTDYSIENFSDIVEAIHVVQNEMGITGTTALEAEKTITGSLMMTKAAWSNLVTGIADDNADFNKLIDNFVYSAGKAANNLLPRIEIALVGVGKLIEELFPVIMDRIPEIITNTLPSILKSAGNVVIALADGIITNLPLLTETAFDLLVTLVNGIIASASTMTPQIVDAALQIINTLANGITTTVPALIPAVIGIIIQIINELTNPATLTMLVEAAIAIILALADGIIAAIPQLLEAVPVIVTNLVMAIIENAPKLLVAALQLIVALAKGIFQNIPRIISAALEIVAGFARGIASAVGSLVQKGVDMVNSVKNGVMSVISSAVTWGRDLIQNFIDGILQKWNSLKSTVNNVAQSVKDRIGFSEPKLGPLSNFHTYAPDMMELFAKGIRDNEHLVTDQINKSFDFGRKTVGFDFSANGNSGGFVGGGSNVSVVQNIYSKAQTAADLMQEAIYQQERAVWIGV